MEQSIDKAKTDYIKSMSFANPDDQRVALCTGVPVSLSVLGGLALAASLTGGFYTGIPILASVLVGAVAAYKNYQKVKDKDRKESDVSYLVDIDNKFSKYDAASYCHMGFEEFIND